MAHGCGLLHLHQGNPAQYLLHVVNFIFNSSHIQFSWSWPLLYSLIFWVPGLRFLPSLFCVCKLDLFSSTSRLIFCLVLSNDEKACSYSWLIPSCMERSSEHDRHLPASPNKVERQNTLSMVFLLRCKVFYRKNAGCMWHCEKYAKFHSHPIMEPTRL